MKFTIRIPVSDIVSMDTFRSMDYGVACYLDDKLRELGAPHVGGFMYPERFWARIRPKYECITQTTDPITSEKIFTFKLGDTDENS